MKINIKSMPGRPSPQTLVNIWRKHWEGDGRPSRFHVDPAGKVVDSWAQGDGSSIDEQAEIDYDCLAGWAHDVVLTADPNMAVRVLAAIQDRDQQIRAIRFGIEVLDDDEFAKWSEAIVAGPKWLVPVCAETAVVEGATEMLLALMRACSRAKFDMEAIFGEEILKTFTGELL